MRATRFLMKQVVPQNYDVTNPKILIDLREAKKETAIEATSLCQVFFWTALKNLFDSVHTTVLSNMNNKGRYFGTLLY